MHTLSKFSQHNTDSDTNAKRNNDRAMTTRVSFEDGQTKKSLITSDFFQSAK